MKTPVVMAAIAVAAIGFATWLFVERNGDPLGRWHDETGAAVPPDVVRAFSGGRHCGWDSATLLRVDVRLLGGNRKAGGRVAFFVRDPENVVSAGQVGEYEVLEDLPDGAVSSGLSAGDTELWFDAGGRTALLVTPDDVEAWPRTKGAVACG